MSSRARWVGLIVAGAVAFGLAHTQAPLYYSNQNQYFLHGLAEGGLGLLDEDWLANTGDPTPVFSALVAATYRYLDVALFHVYFFVLLAVYFCSLALVPQALGDPPRTDAAYATYLALLIAVHAAIFRVLSVDRLGVDYPWYLQTGVANQYILGPGLQPSVFGVLLIASAVAFALGRPVLAATSAVAAAIFHATYLLPAAFFIATYVGLLWHAGRWRAGLLLGLGALAAVLPVAIYSASMFAPSSPEQFAEAQSILADFRIPHHAKVSQWLDGIALAELAEIAVALVLIRRTALFPVLGFPALAGLALSLVQVATGSHTLALLFPWRISAVLVPLATAIVLARLTQWRAGVDTPRSPWRGRWLAASAAILVAVSVVGGVLVSRWHLGYRTDEQELPMMAYVWAHKQPGDVYLVPVKLPNPAAAPRGAASTTFKPPPSAAKGLIPVDLQRFRLVAGAPLYVDFKAIPYKDTDVLEWYRRIQLSQQWYKDRDWSSPAVLAALAREGITHLVLAPEHLAPRRAMNALQLVYADKRYRVYRLPVFRGGN